MDFSIIVCTYNGSRKLPATLNSFKRMVIPNNVSGEFIFVDNNSDDETKLVIERFAREESPLPLTYCFEPSQGLSYARNTGIHNSNGDIIIFTDDDCVVSRNWIAEILSEFSSHPDISLLGGQVRPYKPEDRAATLYLLNERRYFTFPEQTFSLLPGCNMSFRKSIVECVGEFDTNFGAGRKVPSAEDSDFFYRAFRSGFKMVYSPKVLIYHNHGRQSIKQVKKLFRGYVIGQGAFYCKHLIKKDPIVFRMLLREIRLNIKSIFLNFYHLKNPNKSFRRLNDIMTGFYYHIVTFYKK